MNSEGGRHKFFNVWPYIKPLRAWIHKLKRRQRTVDITHSMHHFAFDQKTIMESMNQYLQL